MAEIQWRYRAGDVEQGPITTEELCRLFAAGTLRLDTIVWCPAVDQWVQAATIPGFRQAAGTAPPSDQPVILRANPLPPNNFYQNAAKAAWAAPLLAMAVTFTLAAGASIVNHGAAHTTSQAINACISGALVLCGFFAGIMALLGAGTSRKQIRTPAIIGVALNGLIILTGVWTFTAARAASAHPINAAQLYREGISSVEDFPGWIGPARLPGGAVVVGTLDDQSPTARRVLDELTTPCSVITITISNAASASPITLDPSSLRLLSTQGTIDALAPEDVLATARASAIESLRRLSAPQVIPAGQKACVTVCFIPRDIDLHQVAAVTVRINGQKMTIPGRFFSSQEKQKQLQEFPGLEPTASATAGEGASF